MHSFPNPPLSSRAVAFQHEDLPTQRLEDLSRHCEHRRGLSSETDLTKETTFEPLQDLDSCFVNYLNLAERCRSEFRKLAYLHLWRPSSLVVHLGHYAFTSRENQRQVEKMAQLVGAFANALLDLLLAVQITTKGVFRPQTATAALRF
ncbi:hypothetical protein BAUCODRAFT_331295 [Baudoinia panamericana UAMH 10762]|uniref:Uncharacterized protein n=1 Tax=Baudoinia panamericana (strain UAMH 10762) TaxID=717646 RepID=M2LAS5_BAUPA|nr:uncharacterized protein BAUCODRAFT_331295 [Baudoinia panamericana UAMH 10762]EMC90917.1 hypothetical protein BAUCODRAFT_331295 [Baudoinia panamericana UAMH 10762]